MNLNLFYSRAIEAAIVAGNAIKSIYLTKKYDIEYKSDDSPVTRADKTSSSIIAEYLKETSYPVVDEEHCCPDYSIRKNWKYLWLVDPMDGTKEFISGNGEFTVNIALIENCTPIFGVIYAPVTGNLYWGGGETGSYKIETIDSWTGFKTIELLSKKLNPDSDSGKALRVAASRSHLDDATKKFVNTLKTLNPNLEYISRGSSLKLCMIAEGTTDVYPRFSRTMEWDTAAGHAIVNGTNGVLLKANTKEVLTYNKQELANPAFFALSGIQYKKGLEFMSFL